MLCSQASIEHIMVKIGLISDTHGYLDEAVYRHFAACDEIWHAGDFGVGVAEPLQSFKPLRGVYGNIDDQSIRSSFPGILRFSCEEVDVMMTHIGGYPGKYAPGIRQLLSAEPPRLFICGHSHILRIIFDKKLQCLHINPGAAGKQGWHKVRTLIRFNINGNTIDNCEVIELGKR